MVSQTKLEGSFPQGQFLIETFHSPFRFDLNKNGEGIILYVREDIPVKLISHDFPSTKIFFVEINLYTYYINGSLTALIISINKIIKE